MGIWAVAWRSRHFRWWALLALPALGLALFAMDAFVRWVEQRPGVVLQDPLLLILPVVDLSWVIFLIFHAALFAALAFLVQRPRSLVLGVWAYVIMLVFRAAVMWAAPLDPPTGIIVLRDPLMEVLGMGRPLTRDLFFSGHTSTACLLAFATPGKWPKLLLSICAAVVGTCVLLQRVHYSVDVLAAPAFAYAAWCVAKWLRGQDSNLR